MVTIHDTNGNKVDLTSRSDIEAAILQNNRNKFQQSFHTPFLQPPLRHLFGFKGQTSAARSVLARVYDTPDDLDFYVRELLEELHMPRRHKNTVQFKRYKLVNGNLLILLV